MAFPLYRALDQFSHLQWWNLNPRNWWLCRTSSYLHRYYLAQYNGQCDITVNECCRQMSFVSLHDSQSFVQRLMKTMWAEHSYDRIYNKPVCKDNTKFLHHLLLNPLWWTHELTDHNKICTRPQQWLRFHVLCSASICFRAFGLRPHMAIWKREQIFTRDHREQMGHKIIMVYSRKQSVAEGLN